MFSIELSNFTKKYLRKADRELTQRLLARIEKLAENPFPSDVKRVVNREEKLYRIRVGDYRIQYLVRYDCNQILIMEIEKRSRAYQ